MLLSYAWVTLFNILFFLCQSKKSSQSRTFNFPQNLDGSSQSQMSSEASFDSIDTETSSFLGEFGVTCPDSIDSAFGGGSIDPESESAKDKPPHQMKKTDSGYRSIEMSSRYSAVSWSQSTMDDMGITRQTSSASSSALPKVSTIPSGLRLSDSEEDDEELSSNKSSDHPYVKKSLAARNAKKEKFYKTRRLWHSMCTELDDNEASSSSTIQGAGVENKTERQNSTKKRRGLDPTLTDERRGKRSVMVRFMSPRRYSLIQQRTLNRDYSIDEKSDRLFREFSKPDPYLDLEYSSYTLPRRSRRIGRHRTKKHSKVSEGSSSRSHMTKISPQDSIEEENPGDSSRDPSLNRTLESPDTQSWNPPPSSPFIPKTTNPNV